MKHKGINKTGDLGLTGEQVKRLAELQNISTSAIYQRVARNWTLDDIVRGHKPKKEIKPRSFVLHPGVRGRRTGQRELQILMFDVVSSLCPDASVVENAITTIAIWKNICP